MQPYFIVQQKRFNHDTPAVKDFACMSPTPDSIRQLFDEQVRQSTVESGTGSRVHVSPQVVRWSANGDVGWSEIAWFQLDDENADGVIAQQFDFFSSIRQSFVWRIFEEDHPADLGTRLEKAGMHFAGTSELMIVDVGDLPLEYDLPSGVELVAANDEEGIARLVQVHEKVFGTDHSQLRRSLLAQRSNSPDVSELVVGMYGGRPISSARVEFLPGQEFASLWGGSSLAEWRRRGLYRAMVSYRARLAIRRGYTYLYVTASPLSRPVLEHLGFESFGSVATYEWRPDD
jgi:hypothetical protein